MQKWLVPCNISNFNIVEHFKTEKTAFFKKNRDIRLDDEVYVYVARPYSEIMFKGRVIRTGINPHEIDKKYKISCIESKSFVEVELTNVFPKYTFDMTEMKKVGLGQVVNQQPIRGEVEEYILSKETTI